MARRLSLRFRAWMERNAPFYALWSEERRRHAVTKVDLEAHKVHLALARAQRDQAQGLAVASVAGGSTDAWDDDEIEAFVRSLGERPA